MTNPIGRPSKYTPETLEQAVKLCALGATNQQLAEFFQVNIDTIYEWKKEYPDFSDALKKAKDDLDEKVERSLFQRATGYSHPDVMVVDKQLEPVVKHYPPDPTSMIFWLKNRQPQRWRDRTEQVVSGEMVNKLEFSDKAPTAKEFMDQYAPKLDEPTET